MALLIDSVRRNFGLKATAAVVAVVLWFTFNYFSVAHVDYTKTIEVPIVVRGVSAGLVAAPEAERASVELSGPRPDIESVAPASLTAYVDCSGKQAGTYDLTVNVVGYGADKIKTVQPAQAIVLLDKYAFRTVPVVARDAHGGPLAGALVTPSTIQVAGAQAAVAQVVAAEVNVPEPNGLPVGYSAEMKPVPIDNQLLPVGRVTAVGVVRITAVAQKGTTRR